MPPADHATVRTDAQTREQLAAIDAELSGRRIAPVQWNGRPAYAKRVAPPRLKDRFLVAFFAPLMRWLLTGSLRFEPVRRPMAAAVEVDRLRELRSAGANVPEILAADDRVFVIAAAGDSLGARVWSTPEAEARMKFLRCAARDLALFHAHGFWHGGAQVRNIGISSQGITRFDFEADFDRHLPLVVLQAFDVILFVSSLTGMVDSQGVADIAQVYFALASPQVVAVLKRMRRAISRVARSRIVSRLTPKEAPRMRELASVLERLD